MKFCDEWSELKKWLEGEKRRTSVTNLTDVNLCTNGSFSLYWRPYMQAVLDKMEELERDRKSVV